MNIETICINLQKPQHQHKFDKEGLPVTLARSCTSRSTRTLVGISLADGKNLQSIHSNSGIENLSGRKQKGRIASCWWRPAHVIPEVYLEFAVSWIHNKHDSIHSERGLSDVGSNDAFSHTIWSLAGKIRYQGFLPPFSWLFIKIAMMWFFSYGNLLENLGLEVRGQLGVNRQHG